MSVSAAEVVPVVAPVAVVVDAVVGVAVGGAFALRGGEGMSTCVPDTSGSVPMVVSRKSI